MNRKEEEKADKHILTQRSLILELLVRFLIICISDEYVNTNNRQKIKKEPYISIGDEDSIFKYLLFKIITEKSFWVVIFVLPLPIQLICFCSTHKMEKDKQRLDEVSTGNMYVKTEKILFQLPFAYNYMANTHFTWTNNKSGQYAHCDVHAICWDQFLVLYWQ